MPSGASLWDVDLRWCDDHATIFGIQLLAAIGTVLVFGLAADLMNTYMLNRRAASRKLARRWSVIGLAGASADRLIPVAPSGFTIS